MMNSAMKCFSLPSWIYSVEKGGMTGMLCVNSCLCVNVIRIHKVSSSPRVNTGIECIIMLNKLINTIVILSQ